MKAVKKMNYISEVAELYLSLNSQITILSVTDYSTIAEWEKQEIPVEVVKATLRLGCSEEYTGSLDDMRPLVKENYEKWLRRDPMLN